MSSLGRKASMRPEVRKMFTVQVYVSRDLAPSLPGGVNDFVAIAKEWYENGY
jgi:hypothetical protein